MRVLVLVLCLAGCTAEPEPLVVFAAASMTDVANQLAELHRAEEGRPVLVSVGATSTLVRQIEAGAPAAALVVPVDDWVERLRGSSRVASSRTSAQGRLSVAIPASEAPWQSLRQLAEVERVAVADPAHVPAGVFARRALDAAGLWDDVSPRVVPVPHVRAALTAVAHGQADAAIVYQSDLAISTAVRDAVVWPDSLQPEILFACVVLRGAGQAEASAYCDHPLALGPGLFPVARPQPPAG